MTSTIFVSLVLSALEPNALANEIWLKLLKPSYSDCVIGVDRFSQPEIVGDEKAEGDFHLYKLALDVSCDGEALLRNQLVKDEGDKSDYDISFVIPSGAHPITTFESLLIKLMREKGFRSTGCVVKALYYPKTERSSERVYCTFSK